MQPSIQHRRPGASRGGFSLLIVMIFTGLGFLFLSNLLRLTSSGTALAERHTDYENARAAAEAATEKVAAQLALHFHSGGVAEVEANLAAVSTLIPQAAEASEWQDFQFSDGAGALGATHVQRVENWAFGPLAWKYVGDVGRSASYRVISNARRATADFGPPAAVRQELQVASIPVFGFGVFYALDLEICSSQDFVVPGRVHCNGNIFLEPDLHTVTFEDDVTSSRQILHESHPLDPVTRTFGNVIYSGARDSQVNTLTFPIGVPNDPVLLRQLITVPPGGEAPTSPLGLLRFYNKAELIITITSTNVVGRSGRYNNFAVTLDGANPPLNQFINTNAQFFDKRENKTVVATDFDVNRFGNVIGTGPNRLTTLLGRRPKTVYVIDTRPANAGQFSAVRLLNGQTLPTGGLTVATPNPLYVQGHYNTPNAHLGTANTSQSEPASLVADAVTLLSEGWSDANSSLSLASRAAANTTVTAAVLTGIVLTGADHYNGGVENTLRLLEHWGSTTLTYNGSLVVLFPSQIAVGRPATPTLTVYWPPTRQFHFDPNFHQETKLPPATPELRTVIRSRWASLRPNTIQ